MSTSRVAIVTGAARGIGVGVAARLVADGYAVAIFDVDESQAQAAAAKIGGKIIGLGVNVADEEAVNAGVAKVVAELGSPTILVNNAGIIRDNLLFKMTTSDWDSVMDVHLKGSFLMTKAVQPHMTEAKFGRIVNMSSVSALGNRGQANYAAAKAGLQGFTKTLAIELGKYGITTNSIGPGFIETEMTQATAERIGVPFEDFKAFAAKEIPVQRVGQPEDIAHTVSFLVSEGAGFVNGQIIYVAGGPRD